MRWTNRMLAVSIALLAVTIGWNVSRSAGQTAPQPEPEQFAPGDTWQYRHVEVSEREAYVQLVPGRAWIHSLHYSPIAQVVSRPVATYFELTSTPQEPSPNIANIFSAASAGAGQIELDIAVPDGLWVRGSGRFTVLYRPLR